MAAAPFGNHPTFGDYLRWAQSVGCKVRSGYGPDSDGAIHATTFIEAPNGRWVIEVGTSQEEYLVPTTIARLDRRLGLKSPYFTLPPPDEEV